MNNFMKFACLGAFFFLVNSVEARDLTYKFGAGWKQSYSNAVVNDSSRAYVAKQLNGIDLTYGLAKDLFVGAFFGFEGNFDYAAAGPKLRYDLQRLLDRDAPAWKYLNIFAEIAFLAKFGKTTKSGITIHAPDLGLEILPFSDLNFSIITSAGLTIDFVEQTRMGFTQGLLGDLGVRYYF